MKLLILVASKRKKGNSSIVARMLEQYSGKYKLDTKTLFLHNFRIDQCDGCMTCVFKGIKCHLKDDFYQLIEEISTADFLVLIAPTYVLSIPGNLKTFLDRFLLFRPYYKENYGKRAASIGIASLSDWEHFQLPFLNTILLSLGFDIADSLMLSGAGPGEVLLDNSIEKKVEEVIYKLLHNNGLQDNIVSKECPVCHSRVFEYTDGFFICPFCRTKGELTDKGLLFDIEGIRNHRFTKENLDGHFNNWILKTKDGFKKNFREVMRRRKNIFGGGSGT